MNISNFAQPTSVATGVNQEPYVALSAAGTTAIISGADIGADQRPANILLTPGSPNPPVQPDFATTGNVYIPTGKGSQIGLIFAGTGAADTVGSFDLWGYRPILPSLGDKTAVNGGILYVPFFIASADFVLGTTVGTANAVWGTSVRFADTIAALTDRSMTSGGALNPSTGDNGIAQIWLAKSNSPFFLLRVRRDDVGATAGTAATTASAAWTQI
jgi:hypothetical protein